MKTQFLIFIILVILLNEAPLHAQYQNNDWSVYFGGKNKEYVEDVAADPWNNIYISGKTETTSGIATAGAYQTAYGGGGGDAFLAKYDDEGNLLWSTYYGGPALEFTYGMAIDLAGEVYIVGATASTSGIASGNVYQSAFGGGPNDAFIAKFSSAGQLLWSTYFGGWKGEQGISAACNQNGELCVVGYTGSTNNVVTPDAHQSAFGGYYDCFLARFTGAGQLLYSTYFGGIGDDRPHDVQFDYQGNIIMGGTTPSDSLSTPGVQQEKYGGGALDAFLSKWSPAGQLIWATYFGGGGKDRGRETFTDADGNIYMTGFTNSTSKISTSGAYQAELYLGTSGNKKMDAYLVKFNPDGKRIWGTYFGGPSQDFGRGLRVTEDNHVLVSGVAESKSNIASPDAFQTSMGGLSDAFLAEFTSTGVFIGATYFGGSSDEPYYDAGYATPMEIDLNGNVYIAPTSASADIPNALNSFHPNGTTLTYDAVLARFSVREMRVTSDNLSSGSSLQALVFPNPANFMVTVNFNSRITGTARLFISDITGVSWYSETINLAEGTNEMRINVKSFPAGVYFVSVDQDKNKTVTRLIVQH